MSNQKDIQKTVKEKHSDNKRRKLIFNWNYSEWGGAQIYFLSIIKEATKCWDVKLLVPLNSNKGFINFLKEFNIEHEFLDSKYDFRSAATVKEKFVRHLRKIETERKVYKSLKKGNLENTVIHLDVSFWQSWLLIRLLSRKAKVFVTLHNALIHSARWRNFVWGKRINNLLELKNFRLFAANQNAKDSLKSIVSKTNWDKIKLTRAAIDPVLIDEILEQELEKEFLLDKFKIPKDKFIVLCVAQFIDRKGRWIFLEACREITKTDSSVHFIWVTPELPTDEDEKKIAIYELNNSFQIIKSETVGGSRKEVLNFFRIADAFVMPSLFEGLPIAILEAMSLGIPTISTNITAIPEAIINEETGLLIEPGDSNELIEAIKKLKENKDLRKNISKKGREYVVNKFDERETARIVLKNYEEILNN